MDAHSMIRRLEAGAGMLRGMAEAASEEDSARRPAKEGWCIREVLGHLLLPVAGVISIFFLLRGHNAPGGGFVGGLVMATGFIVQYMVSGTMWIEARMRIHPQYAVAVGLLCAGGAGMAAWLFAKNFLTSLEWHARVPLLGELHLSSTLLFDLGVYLLVLGAAILILIALAHQSLRSLRRPAGNATTHIRPLAGPEAR